MVNRLLGVAGVEVGLLFLELGPQETKVSLRSRTGFDVRKVAEQFGGGGHAAASGVRYPGPLAAAVEALTAAVRKHSSRQILPNRYSLRAGCRC